ncbi:SbcC/MukB-like Walker B domain-containing protein [Nocardia tengchongensis]|uniref:SbcC/MukB-like Walker B domain-containing protein n=1 Tax=Nocardia tengchongensis TaxID=2055889 RepID=UPI0036890018
MALNLPLFAAVAAHDQAAPAAPRTILLDEVFVGVDTVNRGQIFALLAALDLDLLLTSDHDWHLCRAGRDRHPPAPHRRDRQRSHYDAVLWDGQYCDPA